MNFQQPKNPTCQFDDVNSFIILDRGLRVLKSRKNSGCFFGRICKAVVSLCDIICILYRFLETQTTNLKWMEMVKQPFKTACLEFQVLIFFRPSYTSSHTSCKKTYTEKKYQIWCQYFRSNHEKGFLEPFQVRIAPQTWGQMIRIFQVFFMWTAADDQTVQSTFESAGHTPYWQNSSSETPRKFLPPFHQLVKGVVATECLEIASAEHWDLRPQCLGSENGNQAEAINGIIFI